MTLPTLKAKPSKRADARRQALEAVQRRNLLETLRGLNVELRALSVQAGKTLESIRALSKND